jgi:hypothetical protein
MKMQLASPPEAKAPNGGESELTPEPRNDENNAGGTMFRDGACLQGESMNESTQGPPRRHVTTELRFVFLDAVPSAARRWVTTGAAVVDVVVGTAGTVQSWVDARTAISPLLAIVIGPGPVHGAAVVRVDDRAAAMHACAVLAALVGGNDRKTGTVGPLDAHDLAGMLGKRAGRAVDAIVVRAHGETFTEGARAIAERLHGRRVTNAVVLLTFSSKHDTVGDANAGMTLLFDADADDVDVILGMRSAAVALRRPRIDLFAVLT